MSKLQVCLSFKNTKEEIDLYDYLIGQTDKSVFLKNLIRDYKNGTVRREVVDIKIDDVKTDPIPQVINHGKKTKNKFLA